MLPYKINLTKLTYKDQTYLVVLLTRLHAGGYHAKVLDENGEIVTGPTFKSMDEVKYEELQYELRRVVKPTEEDAKNYSYDPTTSPFHHNPENFLKLGDKVRAKFRIWDSPHPSFVDANWGWVSAQKGEEGVVEHVQEGCWPTVRFANGRATCVTDFEVEKLEDIEAMKAELAKMKDDCTSCVNLMDHGLAVGKLRRRVETQQAVLDRCSAVLSVGMTALRAQEDAAISAPASTNEDASEQVKKE